VHITLETASEYCTNYCLKILLNGQFLELLQVTSHPTNKHLGNVGGVFTDLMDQTNNIKAQKTPNAK